MGIPVIAAKPLTSDDFLGYGSVIEKGNGEQFAINGGRCIRHHGLAIAETAGKDARTGVSIFSGQPYSVPHRVMMVERHPLGSQAFFPLGTHDWLVIVCSDDEGQPVKPVAFLAGPHQGINIRRNIWHGVLTPLHMPSDFLVVDRIGPGENLQEHHFDPDAVFDVIV